MTGASVVAVLFVVLMSLPRAGGPVALPALAVLWGVLSGLALLLHAELPVPQGMVNVRLFPDSKVQVRLAADTVLAAVGFKMRHIVRVQGRRVAGAGRAGQGFWEVLG